MSTRLGCLFLTVVLLVEKDGKVDVVTTIDFKGGEEWDPCRVKVKVEKFGGCMVRAFSVGGGSGLEELQLEDDGCLIVYPEPTVPPGPPKPLTVAKGRRKRKSPIHVALLTPPFERKCGIATYSKFLFQELNRLYPVRAVKHLSEVQPDALLHCQHEFGVFPYVDELVGERLEGNYAVATFHTVVREPVGEMLRHYHTIDQYYDAHIVHNYLAKKYLSAYTNKKIFVIPHGSLLFDPLPQDKAREMLSLPKNKKIVFSFGFMAESKGFEEIAEAAGKMKDTLFIISGAIHDLLVEHGLQLADKLRELKPGNLIVLGKYLSEAEINCYASASDVLLFNYKTPKFVSSASGAMHRVIAAGKPVVSTFDNRLVELEDGTHVLKYEQGDLEGMVHCLSLVFEDGELAEELGKNARRLAERTSCENWYDEEYFAGTHGGKIYVTPNGKVERWSYFNPRGIWEGCGPVAKAWVELFKPKPKNALDVGSGQGGFVAALRKHGVKAEGFDFSEYAVEHHHPECKREWLKLHDATKPWPYKDRSFDLVVCMPGDTPILTKSGWKKIVDVNVGDLILSHKGWCKVTKPWVRHYKGKIIVIKPRYAPPLKLTPEHRVLVVKRRTKHSVGAFFKRKRMAEEWVEARNLKPRDFIVFPIPSDVEDVEEIDLLQLLGRGDAEKYNLYRKVLKLRKKGLSLYKISDLTSLPVKTIHQWVNNTKKPKGVILEEEDKIVEIHARSNPINRLIKVDRDFMTLMGLYLGDGSTNKNNVIFSYGSDDEAIKETQKLSKRIFGVEATVEESRSNLVSVVISSKLVSKFFKILFEGRHAPEKRMPTWFLYLPKEKQEALIRGLLLSDGCYNKNRRVIVTTSEELAKQTWLMLLRLGKLANYYEHELTTNETHGLIIRGKHRPIQISWGEGRTFGRIINGRAHIPIYKVYVEDYDGLVYNLETEDNSYTTISGCVHNCLDFYEHIYEGDLSNVLDEMFRVAGKWIFLQIAVVGGGSGAGIHREGFSLRKGELPPKELIPLKRKGWAFRDDLVEEFFKLVPDKYMVNWKQNLVLVLERV